MRLCSQHSVVFSRNPYQLLLWSTGFLPQVSLSLTLAACLAPEMTESFLCKAPLPWRKLNHYHTDPSNSELPSPRAVENIGSEAVKALWSFQMLRWRSVQEKGWKTFIPINSSIETQELLLATSLGRNLSFTFVFEQVSYCWLWVSLQSEISTVFQDIIDGQSTFKGTSPWNTGSISQGNKSGDALSSSQSCKAWLDL